MVKVDIAVVAADSNSGTDVSISRSGCRDYYQQTDAQQQEEKEASPLLT